jgi:hypothetical protein
MMIVPQPRDGRVVQFIQQLTVNVLPSSLDSVT